jgi:hypothetical protein
VDKTLFTKIYQGSKKMHVVITPSENLPIDTLDNTLDSPPGRSKSKKQQSNNVALSSKQPLRVALYQALSENTKGKPTHIEVIADRIANEVERICSKSDRIKSSGESDSWLLGLAKHRLSKCVSYYELGSRRGRIELHSHLSAIVYRYISPPHAQLSFQGRYSLIEDFLQDFYVESIKAFRRENELPENYQPRSLLQLAEYMVFTECYAKRRIHLHFGNSQQLIILRAQTFSKRQPADATVDIEQAFDTAKEDDGEGGGNSRLLQQLRSKMVSDSGDPSEGALRDRVIGQLIDRLREQGQEQCVDYLLLKLEDLSAPEIEEVLGIDSRQRDYLQQRFKYHIEKFARVSSWELVLQWLGAEIDQKLGLTSAQWLVFTASLNPDQLTILELKQSKVADREIMKTTKLTEKKLEMRWSEILSAASELRNQN